MSGEDEKHDQRNRKESEEFVEPEEDQEEEEEAGDEIRGRGLVVSSNLLLPFLLNENIKLKAENARLKAELEETREAIPSYKSTIAQLNLDLVTLQAENKKLRRDNKTLTKKVAALEVRMAYMDKALIEGQLVFALQGRAALYVLGEKAFDKREYACMMSLPKLEMRAKTAEQQARFGEIVALIAEAKLGDIEQFDLIAELLRHARLGFAHPHSLSKAKIEAVIESEEARKVLKALEELAKKTNTADDLLVA